MTRVTYGEIDIDASFMEFGSKIADGTEGRFVFRGGCYFTDWFGFYSELSASTSEEDFGVDVTLSTFFMKPFSMFTRGISSNSRGSIPWYQKDV